MTEEPKNDKDGELELLEDKLLYKLDAVENRRELDGSNFKIEKAKPSMGFEQLKRIGETDDILIRVSADDGRDALMWCEVITTEADDLFGTPPYLVAHFRVGHPAGWHRLFAGDDPIVINPDEVVEWTVVES